MLNFKKILSIILCFAMIFSMIAVFANETQTACGDDCEDSPHQHDEGNNQICETQETQIIQQKSDLNEENTIENTEIENIVTESNSNLESNNENHGLYDEYFSTEHVFPEQSYKIDKEHYLSYPTESVNRYLTKMASNSNTSVMISNILVRSTDSYVYVNGYIYAIQNDRKIIKCDENFENIILLYESAKDITNLQTDGEAFFFITHDVSFDQKSYETTTQDMSPKTVCRLHLPSGIVDEVYKNSTGIYSLEAISNNKISFSIFNDNYITFVASEDYSKEKDIDKAMYARYIYEIKENVLTDDSAEYFRTDNVGRVITEEEIRSNLYAKNVSVPTFITNINGTTIPIPGYEHGKYFNSLGNLPCNIHNTYGAVSSTCIYYKNSTQCAGFAHKVFDTIWNIPENGSTEYDVAPSNYTEENLRSTFANPNSIGSVLRSENAAHSMVLLGYNPSTELVITYEANVDYKCGIQFKEYTLAEFYQKYYRDFHMRTHTPNHTHTYQDYINVGDGKTHKRVCSDCGYNEITAHTASTWQINNTQHYKICSSCNAAFGHSSHNSFTYTPSDTGHLKCCGICSYDVPEAEAHSLTSYETTPATHRAKCTKCGYMTATTAHSFSAFKEDGDMHYKECTVCKLITETAAHTYGGAYTLVSETLHSQACTGCGKLQRSSHNEPAAWVNNGSSGHYKVCSICQGKIKNGGHTYGGYINNGSTGHKRVCTACGYSVSGAHTYGSWSTTGGTHARSCTSCGFATSGTHSFTGWSASNGSVHSRSCTICGYSESGGHSFGGWTIDNASTHGKSCGVCGYRTSAGHTLNYGGWYNVSTYAVCKRRTVSCVYCSYSYSQNDTSHSYIGGKCQKCGFKKY